MKPLSNTPKNVKLRQRYYDCKARGMCIRCIYARAVPGRVLCQPCADKNNAAVAIRHAERRAAYQCINCGRDLEPSQRAEGRDRCSFCEDRHDMANYNYRM